MSKAHILIVDDEAAIREALQTFFADEDYKVTTCVTADEALKLFRKPNEQTFDVILSDVNLPGMSGHQFVRALKEFLGELPPTIMMTAYGSIESAVEAMKLGAFDYLAKPFQLDDLQTKVDRILQFSARKESVPHPQKREKQQDALGGLIGKSPQMQKILDLVRRVSKVDSNVLVLGESGTGKEVVARAIHSLSPRSGHPFIAINCAAIPESLLESELFGHSKGAFTGAVSDKRGLIEEADGGVLFLDEIGDMDIGLQAKLLRVIQERKVKPVGQNQLRNIDIRIIAATHRDLQKAMETGAFREDLYYRLNVMPISLPPLRERMEDIPLLAEHFMKKALPAMGRQITGFTSQAMEKLMAHPWKGNVRQLANVIERAIIFCDRDMIEEQHIVYMNDATESSTPVASETNSVSSTDGKLLTFEEMEKLGMIKALQKTDGNKEESAKLLGISRKTFYRKEKEYGLVKKDNQPSESLPPRP